MMYDISEKNIFLYGYIEECGRTRQIYENISKNGNDIVGIIDKKAGQKGYEETIKYEKLLKLTNKDEVAIVLCFWDANRHSEVADSLYADGFDNIIFLPFNKKYDFSFSILMRQKFNKCLYGGIEKKESFPSYSELIGKDTSIICKFDNYIEIWLSKEKLNVAIIKEVVDVDKEYPISIFSGLRIEDVTYYNELYDYFYRAGSKPEGYLRNNIKGRTEEELLNNRRRLFSEFDYRIKYDPSYFIDSPIMVKWNSLGHFDIMDGMHRAVYLLNNGYKKLPVIMPIDDYYHYKGSE